MFRNIFYPRFETLPKCLGGRHVIMRYKFKNCLKLIPELLFID